MAYTTEVAIENYLQTDIDNSFSSQIADWISAAEKYINNYCNKPEGFEAVTQGTRYFEVKEGTKELLVDQFTNLTSVQILEEDGVTVNRTLVENTDFWAYPLNTTLKYRLVLMPGAAIYHWTKNQRVKIVADWGGVTKDIELATTMLVGKIIEKGMKGGTVTSESLGDYSITYADVENVAKEMGIQKILAPYRNWTV